MEDHKNRIAELEAEVQALKEEVEKYSEREKDLEDTRKAMLFLLEDINEKAEGLLEAKNEWETTFDSIADLLMIHDSDMRILRCNKAYQAASGMSFKEIIGKPYYEVFPKNDKPFNSCVQNVNSKTKQRGEEEITVSGGDRIYKIKTYSLPRGEDNYLYIHIMADITSEKKAQERTRLLYEFSNRIITGMDLDYRLNEICGTAVKFGYSTAWIGVIDAERKDVVPRAAFGNSEAILHDLKIKFDESSFSRGPTGRAVKSKRPEVQDNFLTDPSWADLKEIFIKLGIRSGASFPIMEGDKVIAVLSIYHDNDIFPKDEMEFLHTFANNSSAYIRNAMLFEDLNRYAGKIQEEAELNRNLLKIADSTAHTTDIEKLLEQTSEALRSIMGASYCASYLWDGERKRMQPCRASGLSHEAMAFFKVEHLDRKWPPLAKALEGTPVIERLSDNGKGRNVQPFRWAERAGTAVLIPLIGREDYLGLLACIYAGEDLDVFTERDVELMRSVSNQVSIALDEARLYKESIDRTMDLSRKIEIIQTMHEIDASILSSFESQEILETSTMMLGKLVNCDRATIILADKERGGFVYAAGFGASFIRKGDIIPFNDTSATEVLRTGRPQYIPDMREHKRPSAHEKLFLKEGFMSQLRFPLTVKGEIIGVLNIGSKRTADFSSEDLSIIEKLASQISIALESARLLGDLKELFIGVVRTLSEAIDAKSPWTRGHSERVTAIAVSIGREMGFSESDIKELELAGLLHDIGKLGTYESILDKPGKLTEEELNIMKRHPGKGAEILSPIRQMREIVPVIKYHHEFYDGTGYPEGIKGDAIPLMARILAVADSVDAMGADRPYRKGRPMGDILTEVRRCSGTQFDPMVVDAFIRTLAKKVA